MEENSPLVSILVVSYNSSNFILDTLESIKNQLYNNIELIISDDCSVDETINISRNWLYKNQDKFKRTLLIESNKNTGIPANFNRGIKEVNGEWVKIIAADDILLPTCILDNVEFVKTKLNCKVVFSNLIKFSENANIKIGTERKSVNKQQLKFSELEAEEQYRQMLSSYLINTPSLFIYADLVKKIGYDERYRLIDHYPLILNVLKDGNKIFYLNKDTVLYRLSNNSVSNKGIEKQIFSSFYKDMYEFDKDYRIPYFSKIKKISYYYEFFMKNTFDFFGINKRTFPYQHLYALLYRLNILRYF